MIPVLLWSFGAGVWFANGMLNAVNRRPAAAGVAFAVSALYVVIALATGGAHP